MHGASTEYLSEVDCHSSSQLLPGAPSLSLSKRAKACTQLAGVRSLRLPRIGTPPAAQSLCEPHLLELCNLLVCELS